MVMGRFDSISVLEKFLVCLSKVPNFNFLTVELLTVLFENVSSRLPFTIVSQKWWEEIVKMICYVCYCG